MGTPGVHLKYDETVVYTNDAILPVYLIVYSEEPPAIVKTLSLLFSLFKTPLAN
jgi:hypothetical protein